MAVSREYGVEEEEMQYDIRHCGKEGLLVSIDSYVDPWDTVIKEIFGATAMLQPFSSLASDLKGTSHFLTASMGPS
jgi:hypothetical protein